MMFRYYQNKLIPRLKKKFFQPQKVTGIFDSGNSNLKEIFDVFPPKQIIHNSQSAYPEAIEYEFSAKKAYVFENINVWSQCSIVGIPPNDSIIRDSAFNHYRLGKLMSSDVLRRYPVKNVDGMCTSIQCGPGWENYYHWLVDNLPRLYTLSQPRFQKEPLIYLYLCGNLPSFVHQVLDAVLPANIKKMKTNPNRRLFVSKYIWLPYLSGDCSGYLPPTYLQWLNDRLTGYFHLRPIAKPDASIYISRQGASQRSYNNESSLIDAFAKLGLKSYRLEEYSFRDQVNLFRKAKLVVGRHGAGFTNLMFSNHTKVFEHFSSKPFNHYRLLCKAKNIQYSNLISPGENKNSNIDAPIDELVSRVEQLLLQS